eukprot:COSAG05_NODE_709_length_7823_cov_2.423485_4_plen_558_part_00
MIVGTFFTLPSPTSAFPWGAPKLDLAELEADAMADLLAGSLVHQSEEAGGLSPAADFHSGAVGNSRKKMRVSVRLGRMVTEPMDDAKPPLSRQSSGEGSGGRRSSWERDSGFGGMSARKRPRTPRSLSPTGEVFSTKGTMLLSDAVDREDNRLDRTARAEAKKRGGKKKKRTPEQLMGEIVCSCAQCAAASSILSRGRSSGEQSIHLDEKSWLECFDRKHRYGSNLRPYYHAWRELGLPGKHFWAWLDESSPLPDLPCLRREKLEAEVVTYLSPEERTRYRVNVEDGLLIKEDGSLLHTGSVTREGGNEWIFVLGAADQMLYAHRKETQRIPRFHHTSFLAAEPVKVAGQIEVSQGRIQSINLHSGHYRPREDRDLLSFLDVLEDNGVDLDTIRVDVQRMLKSSRHGPAPGARPSIGAHSAVAAAAAGGVGGGAAAGAVGATGAQVKQPKRNNRKMWKGLYTRWFLQHKKAAQPFLAEIRSHSEQPKPLRSTRMLRRSSRSIAPVERADEAARGQETAAPMAAAAAAMAMPPPPTAQLSVVPELVDRGRRCRALRRG